MALRSPFSSVAILPSPAMMMTDARENARTLAAALGVNEDQAGQMLDVTVVITATPNAPAANALADDLSLLLCRTVQSVTRTPWLQAAPAVEIVVGQAARATSAPTVWVNIAPERIAIGSSRMDTPEVANVHPALLLLCACY